MSRVFISGSSDGLGLMAARLLVDGGHEVTLHARNTARAENARRSVPQAKAVAVGDLSSIEETRPGQGRQTCLHSQSLDQKSRAQTRAEKALVPPGPEMAHRL
jgi:NAD(P)-dependent dehydrogenase (short-subunit alcohol dehydrogenase family)